VPTSEMTTKVGIDEVRQQLRQGEYLLAYDLADQALEHMPDDDALRHAAVLALARTGAIELAQQRFIELGLNDVRTEEVISLKGRLSKDLALSSAGAPDLRHLRTAIAAYEDGYSIDQGYFPAINVATLSAIAGNLDAAQVWARRALEHADKRADKDGYYAHATRAEALILLGKPNGAAQAITSAVDAHSADFAARSTTLRQLHRLCAVLDLNASILEPLRPPDVVHYSGHIIALAGEPGRFPAYQEASVAGELAAHFSARPISRAVGSLAAGADILAAEAALAAGAALDVVMPFDKDEFVRISVAPSGPAWVDRFRRCFDAANRVHFVTEDAYLGDDELFGYATEYALGLTRLRGQWLSAKQRQVVVWDGEMGPSGSGTSHDLKLGRATGFEQQIIRVESTRTEPCGLAAPLTASHTELKRVRRAMIFGDFKGFSKLTDGQLPDYVSRVLGACADVLERYETSLHFKNTWGDGLFLVFDDIAQAAECAFHLQEAITSIDHSAHNLPNTLGLRLGFHYGPVYVTHDPVLNRENCFGFHVSRAARIEPITPEGSVYVTEQTAAAIALADPDRYRSDYVGRQPLAKGYGSFPMYHLRRI